MSIKKRDMRGWPSLPACYIVADVYYVVRSTMVMSVLNINALSFLSLFSLTIQYDYFHTIHIELGITSYLKII